MQAPASPVSEGSDMSAPSPSHQPPPCDIFNTTFSLHQASPLFVGSDGLSPARLTSLEQQLRDILVGDVVRGVEVGLDNDSNTMGGAGGLEVVTIAMVATEGVIATSESALQISLQYENALCLCLLLPLPEAVEHTTKYSLGAGRPAMHLPLLLLRMPLALKSIITNFLSDTFDCRVNPISLSGIDIIRSWELWARETGVPTTGQLAKDTVLTLSFCLAKAKGPPHLEDTEVGVDLSASPVAAAEVTSTPNSASLGIKTIDIFIPNEDLRGFIAVGRQHKARAQAGLEEPGRPNRLDIDSMPFSYAVACYVKHHLALDMANPAVTIVRIACGGFVLAESRLKLLSTPDSNRDLVSARHRTTVSQLLGGLVLRAAG
ncbi:siroheme synthase [Ophiostoma piceae UAMH 11346]|uniref:Siroheme synthase n=1 Tax=Ophiostoma piceae (strain UAMH 11346) TaxID=1262450 RepID=S3CT00_OPHP1|nr:siroheme synthase [Ophiostoma piceae UAMH 11346]